jgi:hypothetical protein
MPFAKSRNRKGDAGSPFAHLQPKISSHPLAHTPPPIPQASRLLYSGPRCLPARKTLLNMPPQFWKPGTAGPGTSTPLNCADNRIIT